MHNFLELEIGLGRFIVILIFLYFTVKWAVKNGIKDYFEEKEEETNSSNNKESDKE